jgi:hypothetical protein
MRRPWEVFSECQFEEHTPQIGCCRYYCLSVLYWLHVTNYNVLYVLFDSALSGSNYIDVWDLCLHAQTASPIISSQRFSDESRLEQTEKLFCNSARAAFA